jgi:threonine dehydratase
VGEAARLSAVPIDEPQIEKTYAVIRPHVRVTPVLELSGADAGLAPFPLTLKLELLQHSGSFKARGAFANLLLRTIPPAGVVAASGGNHGAAVAYAAMRLGVRARIFVPTVSSPAKISRIRGYGGELVVGGERYADALAASQTYVAESGALPVHAFDQAETLLGQGTLGLELERQTPALDTLLVAVGGGGLIGGIAAWYAGRVKVIGVEPEAAPTLFARRCRRRLAGPPARGRADVSHRACARRPRRAGERRRDSRGPAAAVGDGTDRGGARRLGGRRRAAGRCLRPGARRAGGRGHQRREYNRR